VQFILIHMHYEEFKVKSLILFNTNFAIGNLQLSVGKLQLPPQTFLTHDSSVGQGHTYTLRNKISTASNKWLVVMCYFCYEVSKRSSVGRMDERTFFLFSDILMYAKPRLLDGGASGAVRAWGGVGSRSSSSSSPSLVCCCIMPLHHCRVERVFGQDHGADNNGQGTLFSV